jgi:tRNA uridine 5-carboxymethylaminomethyl modification enzyme
MSREKYDVLVVGGGHAGIEAALAAARMGHRTLLVTDNLDTLGKMSCNPAIGGQAKGQMAREIDALGGEMGRNIDATGIHFRILNTSKGPAVQAPRAQADKLRYAHRLKCVCEAQVNLSLIQDMVEDVLVENDRCVGVFSKTKVKYRARTVVLTTGTFLRGLIHVGLVKYDGGRFGDPSAGTLSGNLGGFGFYTGRMKTGTPPRINGRTIDYERVEEQPGDQPPIAFGFDQAKIVLPQTHCWITKTNQKTQDIIQSNLDRSPLYSGLIDGVGPRYCPSIEDKIVKFPTRNQHQVFLEPEGLDTLEVYCNGISTSLPPDVQELIVHSIAGLERAEIIRYGYAVEYDYFPPTQLWSHLETKKVSGLFFAGQINGTTGYEEAAAQGMVAGINAALKVRGEEPFTLGRAEAYMGVLIDDLVTLGTDEPYRMFSSRAEYRLLLRHDNADQRLTAKARELGLIEDDRWGRHQAKMSEIDAGLSYLKSQRNLRQRLKRPELKIADICSESEGLRALSLSREALRQIELQVKYEGYIERQVRQVEKFKTLEKQELPENLDYGNMNTLTIEAREKLQRVKPRSIGQASRVSGVSPADISALLVEVKARQSEAR